MPMVYPSPRNTLLLLWGIAVVVLVGGFLLARQERQIRINRDREALRQFATATQVRLDRLADLYQDHLLRLGRGWLPDSLEAWQTADQIVGVLHVSLLHSSDAGVQDSHMDISASPDGLPPVPTFSLKTASVDSARPLVLLDENRLFSLLSGWIDEPGKPLMFHVRCSATEIAVITISRTIVEESVQDWIRKWAAISFEPIRLAGEPDQLLGNGKILAGKNHAETTPPALLLPLRSRFGKYELLSWDVMKTEIHYHPATLAITATLATIIALLGSIVFIAQRRDHAMAVQRVSFVNGVSHELRTPLTNILLNIDLAIELAADEPEESENRLNLVRIEARRLGRLIDNVLTFSRIEEGKMEVNAQACVPAEIISSVIDTFTPIFQRRGLTIQRVDENTTANYLLDSDAFAQILGNLLSNVGKYVPSGVVTINTRIADYTLILKLSDQGPGIPAAAAELIFKPFERIHSVTNEGVSGTGLGLAIARDLATRLGGSLQLLPTSSGSCFELRIPVTPISS